MVDQKTHQLGHIGVAISFGLVIMFGIYAVGHISGAHFNPSVTFAFALSRHFPWSRAVGYWGAQLAGALAAAALLRGSLGNRANVGATLPSGIARTGVPVGDRAHLLPDVRDHGRRHRHARRRRGGGYRDRRHRRARRDVRRPDHRRLDEPGSLDWPGARLGQPPRPLALHTGADRGRLTRPPSPTSSCAASMRNVRRALRLPRQRQCERSPSGDSRRCWPSRRDSGARRQPEGSHTRLQQQLREAA